MTSTCCVSTVSGKPRSVRTSRRAAVASRVLTRAHLRVLPWLTQPEIDGHPATQTPSSSSSRVVGNFMGPTLRLLPPFEKPPVCFRRTSGSGVRPAPLESGLSRFSIQPLLTANYLANVWKPFLRLPGIARRRTKRGGGAEERT